MADFSIENRLRFAIAGFIPLPAGRTIDDVVNAVMQVFIADGAAKFLGATPADLPGLWNLPGGPEITTAQLIDLASRQIAGGPQWPTG